MTDKITVSEPYWKNTKEGKQKVVCLMNHDVETAVECPRAQYVLGGGYRKKY